MRSVSIIESPETHSSEAVLNEEATLLSMPKYLSQQRIINAARVLGPKASNTQIAHCAGFASRKTVAYNFGSKIELFKEMGIEIKSPKERLVEATKTLPFYSSSREITKAAGYKSHKIINLYFDSLEELKKIAGKYVCNKETIPYKEVEFSLQDVSKGIKIPEKIDEMAAEEAGLHAGDGSLYSRNGKPNYIYAIGGDPKEEKEYYDFFMKELFKKLYNIEVKPQLLMAGHIYGFMVRSKAIYTFKSKVLKFPEGEKTSVVEVPVQILDGEDTVKQAFIRGLTDTDFSYNFGKKHKSIHYYPTIIGSFASKNLVMQTKKMLKELDFHVGGFTVQRKNRKVAPENILWVKGKKQTEKWIQEIGSNNPKHKTKIAVWQKFGFCPPYTKLIQRKQILAGRLNPYDFYNGGK